MLPSAPPRPTFRRIGSRAAAAAAAAAATELTPSGPSEEAPRRRAGRRGTLPARLRFAATTCRSQPACHTQQQGSLRGKLRPSDRHFPDPAMEENSLGTLQQRAAELECMAEVLLTGEQLRLRLHEEKIIKDRRHHLKTYPNCFVAKELIDWLIDHKEAFDRETAIKLVQKLLDRSIIHHVCDEHKEFKDLKLFYRFRKDDGTFPLDNEVKAFMRGQRIYEKLMNTENVILQAREEEGAKYERTFMASQLIDWLIQEGEAATRAEAEQLGRRLLEHGIIQHVSNKHHFMDSNLLYQFRMNFRRRRRLMELLTEKSHLVPESHDSPFCLRKQNHDHKKHATFLSVLKRTVTPEELLRPGAPYARKTFTIIGDAVGWGFVVRGSKPCHVQAVDPSGPAAASGMKVCQFVISVNGLNVLHADYRTVSNLILTGPRTIVMEVMEEIEP
ncbi:DEP domain-containing mTOR-interacting protein isoform 2-T2 [Vipera latastei]